MLTTRRRLALAFVVALTASLFCLSFYYNYYASATLSYAAAAAAAFAPPGMCRPRDYIAGHWSRRRDAREVWTEQDAVQSSGFLGCASNREYGWHLGTEWDDNTEFPRRWWRGNVSAYDWVPGCARYRRADRETWVTRLVEEGGWLILGGVCGFFSFSPPRLTCRRRLHIGRLFPCPVMYAVSPRLCHPRLCQESLFRPRMASDLVPQRVVASRALAQLPERV